jgi:hypothetical protein
MGGMKEKILEALESGLTDYADVINGDDYVRGYDRGWRRGYREAKELVERIMEREEQARESSIRELDNVELDKLPDGEFHGFSSYVDNQKRETIVPFGVIDLAKDVAVRYRGAFAAIKLEGEVNGYAAVIPFESPKAGEG